MPAMVAGLSGAKILFQTYAPVSIFLSQIQFLKQTLLILFLVLISYSGFAQADSVPTKPLVESARQK
uniref:hypothetical protein n=1 Tax=Stenotrophomonas maltophilia TaxID=40324 RepID=UPI00195323C0